MKPSYLVLLDVKCVRSNRLLFEGVNIALRPGEIVQIRGENGIGKTTLLRTLAGLSKPYSGSIKWQNEPLWDNDSFNSQLFFLGHKNAVKSALTVNENLIFGPSFEELPSNANIDNALMRMGLSDKKNVLAQSLSAGQKQRLALSKLLLSHSKLWILDEPFNSLDASGIKLVQALMREHLQRDGMIIFTSHYELGNDFQNYLKFDLVSLRETEEDSCFVF